MAEEPTTDHLVALMNSVAHPRVLVVGDLLLDCYVWGDVDRISPEGPIPVLRVTSEEERPGGGGNVVGNLHRLGAEVFACGVVGADRNGRALIEKLNAMTRDATGVIACAARPTAVKTRYLGAVQSAGRGVQHMLRVDHETTEPISGETEERILAHLESALPRQQAVVVSDYDKGLLTERILSRTFELARGLGIPTVTDPKIGRAYTVYRGSSVLTPNRYETKLATGIAPDDDDSLAAAAKVLIETADLRHVVITLDRDGMYVAGRGEPGRRIPARTRDVYDVTGAGDMVASILALLLATDVPILDAATVANVAAGIEIAKVGAAPVSRAEIVADLVGERIIETHGDRPDGRPPTASR